MLLAAFLTLSSGAWVLAQSQPVEQEPMGAPAAQAQQPSQPMAVPTPVAAPGSGGMPSSEMSVGPGAMPPAEAPSDDLLSLLSAENPNGNPASLSIRDPFKAPDIQAADETPKGPLERIPLDRFKLLGVITGPDRFRAMLQDPEGQTHLVSERMKLGNRQGVVKKITSKGLWVQEKVVNVLGQEEKVDTVLKLDALGKTVQEAGAPKEPATAQ
jgi:Tfp pilus assembly protein PilP